MRLNAKHEKAIELLFEGRLTKNEIADAIGVSRKTLYNWIINPDFAEELQQREADEKRRTKRRVANLVDKALKRQQFILEKSKNDVAAASVAADVLDRAGYAPEKNVKVDATSAVQIVDDIPMGGDSG